ncbi:MAG: ATP-binding protein [Thermomicrobiales bacterium]
MPDPTFASVGRRLALLSAAVVIATIALVGAVTYVLLRESLNREADSALAARAHDAERAWDNLFRDARPPAASNAAEADREKVDGDHGDDGDHEEGRELLESGDALLFAVDANGRLLANARDVPIPGFPDPAGVRAALAGETDARTITVGDQSIRVYTAPVHDDGHILGAVQAARDDWEHQAELRLVGLMSLIGVGLGAMVALPAGLFLARRAMRPIDLAFARQRAFVADASHEFRTPLTLIRATTEYVQRLPDASPAVREELGGVLDEIDATSRLVDDLLVLARVDSAELPLRRQPTDLGELARAAVDAVAPLAEGSGLSLSVSAPQGVLATVDPDRIRQVLRILLDNAIAYTAAGGTIQVGVERQDSRARLTVTDTGAGIAPEDQARVFDRFYRADRARARATGGAGLGLAIARALVHAHAGEIGLTSEPGRGTTVWFTLPLALAP